MRDDEMKEPCDFLEHWYPTLIRFGFGRKQARAPGPVE